MRTLPVRAETTPAEIVRVQSATLASVNAGTGNTAYSQAVIASLLSDTIEYFGVNWNLRQIAECAELWSAEYHWMTMAEIKLFLVRLKTGYYSKTDFRHLSPFQLMGWLEGFVNELLVNRSRYFEEREAAERRERLIAMDNNPNLVAFDALKVFKSMGVELGEDGRTPEQLEKERIYQEERQKQRERDRNRREENLLNE